jgi:allantoin racemase
VKTRIVKILDIIPLMYTEETKTSVDYRKTLANKLYEETNGLVKLDIAILDYGTASIESVYDEYINAPYILQKVKWAEKEGYNAVVIDCFGDPALDAAREIVNIPVIGANHASTFLAAQIAHRFSIINILPETEPVMIALMRKYGLLQHLVSIETINMSVLELKKELEKTLEKVVIASENAYRKGAYAAVLGCTGMSLIAEQAQRKLLEKGLKIQIIDPLKAAIFTAITWVLMNVSHSKIAYPMPPAKLRKTEFVMPI